jgi:hypothetical protein
MFADGVQVPVGQGGAATGERMGVTDLGSEEFDTTPR